MKKKQLSVATSSYLFKKLLRGMKLTLIFLLAFLLNVSATTYSQQMKVSVNYQNEMLSNVFKDLEKQTDLFFFFSDQVLNVDQKVNIKAENEKLEEVLTKILGNDYKWEVVNNLIVISKKDEVRTPQQQNQITIKGKVTDSKREPLPGATIRIEGTTLGTSTDADGNYTLNLPSSGDVILVFSFIGMESQSIMYSGQTTLDVALEDEQLEMSEVVVTGVFTKAKESYTGSVTTITAQDLQRVGNRSIINSIRNIDPSFNIADNLDIGSDPNKLPNITVRGNSSMTTSVRELQSENDLSKTYVENLPLFIMDGFEISLEKMMDLDENQVESITLLKDASATAMYGTRGANGVVVITSKVPESGKLHVTYRGSLNIEAPDLTSYNLMNAREKLEYEYAAGLYSAQSPNSVDQSFKELYNDRLTDAARGVNTYWLKYPVRTGVGSRHSLRIEGGDDVVRYAIGVGYNNVEGAMKGSSRNTFNGNSFLSYRLNNLSFQNDLQISVNKSYNSPYGTFNDFAKINSYFKPYDDDGNILKNLEKERYYNIAGNINSYTLENPLYNALLPSKDESRYKEIKNNTALEWYILSELFVRARFGITSRTNREDVYVSAQNTKFDSYEEEDYVRKGTYDYTTGESHSYEGEFTLNYTKTFNQVHQLFAGMSYSLAETKTEYYVIQAEGISNPNMDFLGMASAYQKEGSPYGYDEKSRRLGGLVNVNYTYDRRYFIDLSGKIEGSSKFGADNRTAPFWSAGAGWNIHQESFFDSSILNTARVRLSYGTSGSQNFSPYQALMTYKDYGSVNYKGWYGSYLLALGNKDLGWQKTGQLNVGLDADLLNNRIRFTGDFYRKMTDDLLSDVTIPSSSGFTSYKANVGKVENKGFEISLNTFPIRNNEMTLSLGASLVHNKNTIKKISNALEALNESLRNEDYLDDDATNKYVNASFLFEEGQSINTIFVVKSLGIDPGSGKEVYVKKDGSLTYEWSADDKVACGVAEPKYWGNVNTMFRYKNFTFNAVFSYKWGGQMYNSTLVSKVENVYPYNNVDKRALYDRWQRPGDKTSFKGIKDFSSTFASSRFVMDERTFECKSLSLSYDIEFDWVKRNLGLSYLSVSGYTEDVFRISSIKQERGLSYPFSRKFSFALTARF